MVKTWSSGKGEDETCEICGSVYAVTIRRYPTRDKDSFRCVVCGNLMREWNDTAYPSFELKKRGKAPGNDL